jgi:FAD/FMN-containing dehydrogenase
MIGVAFNPEMLFGVTMHMQAMKSALADEVRGVYVNFLEGEEKAASATQAFSPENLDRLHELKQQLDPANRLRHTLAL